MAQTTVKMAAIASFLGLAGCSSTPPAPPAPDPAIMTISRAIDEIRAERRALTDAVRGARPESPPTTLPDYPEFQKPVTMLDWNGPARTALETVANIIGYQFRVSGKRASDPIVHLNANGVAASTVLIEIGDQGEGLFDVRIDPEQRLLTMIYR